MDAELTAAQLEGRQTEKEAALHRYIFQHDEGSAYDEGWSEGMN